MESVLVFDIKGDFGFFKTAEVTRATLSFPFTRTAIIGIIGAILGEEKNSYWNNKDSIAEAEIALELLSLENNENFQHTPLTVNYAHTKYTVNIAARSGTLKTYISDGEHRGFVTNVKLDMLRNIHYRLYYRKPTSSKGLEIYNKLKKYLMNNWTIYPTYLGHANLLADIIFIGEFPMEEINDKLNTISSVIPVSSIEKDFLTILQRKVSIIMNIPIGMDIQNDKVVTTYNENFVIPETFGEEIKIKVKADSKIYSVDLKSENKKGEKKNIIFIPTGKEEIFKKNKVKIFNR
jgi:CRISPR-associated protein Cas5 subtype I-B